MTLEAQAVVSLPDTITQDAVDNVRWWKRAHQPLQDNEHLAVEICTDQVYRTWQGFGGAVSELAWRAVSALPEAERARFFRDVFGPEGMAFDWIRLPIGASDFALDAYSASSVPDDYELAHFSLDRDRSALIPFIKAAQAVNPNLRVHASPWSPPAWMKLSGKMDGTERSAIRDESRVLEAYARYLRKVVEGYAAEGIRIERLMAQNEMDSPAGFPSCAWTPEAFVRFHLDYLKPEWQRAGLDTEIWAGTFRTISGLQAHDCFRDAAFRAFVRGAAFQYSYPQAIVDLQVLHPGTRVMHTECVCHGGGNSVPQAASQFEDVLGYLAANVDVFTYWNLALDTTQRSSWGWKQNSLYIANAETGALVENPDVAVFRLLSRALRPGAVRVRCFSFLAPAVCFRQPDGALVLLLRNYDAPRRAAVIVDGRRRHVDLPGHALCAVRVEA